MLRTNLLLVSAFSAALALTAGSALAKKPAPTPPPPEPAGPVFDRAAAGRALGSVSLLPCKQAKGPTGEGHVIVTFAPSGEVTDANVDRDPYKGTAMGRCIAAQYKHAPNVPRFAGTPVAVGKIFRME
jgi:hypothetical protein